VTGNIGAAMHYPYEAGLLVDGRDENVRGGGGARPRPRRAEQAHGLRPEGEVRGGGLRAAIPPPARGCTYAIWPGDGAVARAAADPAAG
jgi:hypothetical protein